MPYNIENAILSLNGLSTGDAFGECFFDPANRSATDSHVLPEGPWRWTDDTAMAISIVEILLGYGEVDQDRLAESFAHRFAVEPYRGYGGGAVALLSAIHQGGDWRDLAPALFGSGSYGNGAAMRVAPLGGFFSEDAETVVHEAWKSAQVTHYHEEGVAGAIAVAVAASLAARGTRLSRDDYIEAVASLVPESEVKRKIQSSAAINPMDTAAAVARLGVGMMVSAQDTVPFCIWCAANNLEDYASALWQTASGFGDVDTTCAIVGGIVALSAGEVPDSFISRREPLPKLTGE